MIEKDVFSMKLDVLESAICFCPNCKREIKGLANKEEQKCLYCKHEFEVDFTIRKI